MEWAFPEQSQKLHHSAATVGNSGEQFSVIVSDAFGNLPSSAATLTVLQPVPPATYYVDFASGSDENSGVSETSPWQYAPGMSGCSSNCSSISLNPGDSVIFKGGVPWAPVVSPWWFDGGIQRRSYLLRSGPNMVRRRFLGSSRL